MTSSKEFQNVVVLIAGLHNRVSGDVAQAFAREGAKVVLAGKTNSALETIDGDAIFLQTDLSSENEMITLTNKIIQTYGRLDIAVNDSSVTATPNLKMLDEIEEGDWNSVIETHVKSIWLSMKYELIAMRTHQAGRIVNCSSTLGLSGYSGLSMYCAAQHAVIGLTQAAAREYASTNIRVNAVCPALRTANEPVVESILWLSSKRSYFVSGQAIRITGGV